MKSLAEYRAEVAQRVAERQAALIRRKADEAAARKQARVDLVATNPWLVEGLTPPSDTRSAIAPTLRSAPMNSSERPTSAYAERSHTQPIIMRRRPGRDLPSGIEATSIA